jgi:hypothetical protein
VYEFWLRIGTFVSTFSLGLTTAVLILSIETKSYANFSSCLPAGNVLLLPLLHKLGESGIGTLLTGSVAQCSGTDLDKGSVTLPVLSFTIVGLLLGFKFKT